MQSKPYDVVLIPQQSIAKNAIEVSKKLEAMDSYFTLDGKTFFPHVSLYMLQLTDIGLEKAIDLLSAMTNDTKTIEAITKDYHYENNYVDVEYIRSKEFSTLQGIIVEKLNPVRDGLRERDKARLADAKGEERENLMKYGYRSIGDMFSPHLTFTRFKKDERGILTTLPPKDLFNGNYVELGIFEMGDNGTCVRKVKSWTL